MKLQLTIVLIISAIATYSQELPESTYDSFIIKKKTRLTRFERLARSTKLFSLGAEYRFHDNFSAEIHLGFLPNVKKGLIGLGTREDDVIGNGYDLETFLRADLIRLSPASIFRFELGPTIIHSDFVYKGIPSSHTGYGGGTSLSFDHRINRFQIELKWSVFLYWPRWNGEGYFGSTFPYLSIGYAIK